MTVNSFSLYGDWSFPTNIRFGAKRIKEIGEVCNSLSISNPLFVTDRSLSKLKMTKELFRLLNASGLESGSFSEVDPNPSDINVQVGVEQFNSGNHDGVICFGGGSAMDVGKTIAFMARQTRELWDFEDSGDQWKLADQDCIFPIIAVPTTSGTGSEVGRASVILHRGQNEKKIIFHPKMMPSAVICDPDLTVSMPRHITAGTGLDAFAHCVEAFSSPNFHPMSEGIALEGMKIIKENLFEVYLDPYDMNARTHMMCAALMGATSFQKGLGAIHAMSHPIGALIGSHHGITNAVCMLPVLQFNAPAIEKRFDTVASYLSLEGGFKGFCEFVKELNNKLSIPKNLAELGLKRTDLPMLITRALKDPSCSGNPVVLNVSNMKKLFENAFDGTFY